MSIKRPNKLYLLEVLATLDFHNGIFEGNVALREIALRPENEAVKPSH